MGRIASALARPVPGQAEVQPFEELWDPALLIGELWLEPRAGTQVIGREAILVGGSPRPTERPSGTYPAL